MTVSHLVLRFRAPDRPGILVTVTPAEHRVFANGNKTVVLA